MANAQVAALDAALAQERAQQAEEEESEVVTAQGNFLSIDVMLMLLIAVVIDILDVVLALGTLLSLILGAPILGWMILKTHQIQSAKDQAERVRRKSLERAEFQQRQQQRLAERRAATRRVWRRGILYFVGGLIPLLSIFVLWTWAVITTVRGK